MGQKVHPYGVRLGIVKDWRSRWYGEGVDFREKLKGDIRARSFLRKRLSKAGISHIDIERLAKDAKITIYAARPALIIGKGGRDIESLRQDISSYIGVPVYLNIKEIHKPDINAYLVAEGVALQLEKRASFRRVAKRATNNALRAGVSGIKIRISGRLGGAEIARDEWIREGRIPLHTFRANIDYGFVEAKTIYGIIGIKVWIYKETTLASGSKSSENKSKFSRNLKQEKTKK